LVLGKSNIPLVNEGDALFHIARFEDIQQAAALVEAFQSTAENTPNTTYDDQLLV